MFGHFQFAFEFILISLISLWVKMNQVTDQPVLIIVISCGKSIKF